MMPSSNNYFTRIARNNEYYDQLAKHASAPAPAPDFDQALARFTARLPAKGMVLGIGSGNGRDLRGFQALGYTVLGVEPSAERRRASIASGVPAVEGTFENLESLRLSPASGIWCGAALRHVPDRLLTRVAASLSEALVPGGPLFFTVELGDEASWVHLAGGTERAEMLVQRFLEPTLRLVLDQHSLEIVESWATGPAADRAGTWLSVVAVKR